jgi:hypothetical protein
MKKTDEKAFLDYHHKSKILPPNWTEKYTYRMCFMAGIRYERQKTKNLNREVTKWQALAQERLVGAHHCPEWDEMLIVPGYGSLEFAVCSCKPAKK